MTKTYVGVKIVTAWPECRERQTSTGAVNDDGYAVQYADGYTSWSPKDVFEDAYREVPEEDADGILLAVREEMERLANGGLLYDAIGAADAERRERDIRETAIHLSYKTFSNNGAASFNMRDVYSRASEIAAYIENGVTGE